VGGKVGGVIIGLFVSRLLGYNMKSLSLWIHFYMYMRTLNIRFHRLAPLAHLGERTPEVIHVRKRKVPCSSQGRCISFCFWRPFLPYPDLA
jgi:hypothetical protein